MRPAAAGATWLSDFLPGYFALVMGTGIVAVAAAYSISQDQNGFRFAVQVATFEFFLFCRTRRLQPYTLFCRAGRSASIPRNSTKEQIRFQRKSP